MIDPKHLSDACDALGEIMLAISARRHLAKPMLNPIVRAKIVENGRTDEQIGEIAARAFEAAAMVLAKAGYPGATAFTCNPKEEP